ncbi:MAG: extracellular solute-binding protein [Candidatus Thiodiazotropha taylori]
MSNLINNKTLWISLIAIILIAVLFLSSDTKQVNTITVVVREGLESEGLRKVAEVWSTNRDVEVQFETRGRKGYPEKVISDLKNSKPKIDVLFFPGTHVAQLAHSNLLEPIRYWSPDDDQDLLSFSSYKGKIYGLPCDISTFLTFYRSDYLDSPPKTWNELLAYANSSLTNSGTNHDSVKYHLAIAGMAGEELPKIFYPILWSYGGSIFDDKGMPNINSSEALMAANLFKDLLSSPGTPQDIESWGVIEILDSYLAGEVILTTPQWNALYPYFSENQDMPGKNLGVALIPGVVNSEGKITRVNFKHTWDLVLPKTGVENRLELANDFILFATGREGSSIYASTNRGNPARKSILENTDLQLKRPEFPLMLQSIQEARSEPSVVFYGAMHDIINRALSYIISGAKSPEKALDDAANELAIEQKNIME